MHNLLFAILFASIHTTLSFLRLAACNAPTISTSYSLAINILQDTPQQALDRFESDQFFDLSHLHPTTNHTSIGLSSGTIFRKSKVGSVVPMPFTISGTCPALAADFGRLVDDVGQHLIHSHRGSSERWPPLEQFQETVTARVGDVEFRVTLDLITERKMGKAEFAELTGLVVGAVERLFEATGKAGFQSAILRGVHNGIAFKAWWTWYSFVNGVAGPCKGITRTSTPHEQLLLLVPNY